MALKAADSPFRFAFSRARAEQHRLHAHVASPFDAQIDTLVWKVANLAIEDARAGTAKARIVSAPTGSGKTSATVALAAAGLTSDPSFSASFVVEYARQAESLYRELVQLLPANLVPEVAVWTTAHDPATTPEVAARDYGVERCGRTFTRSDLPQARVAIGTHRKLQDDMKHGHNAGLLTFNGKRRSVVFVDETPTLVRLIETTPADVTAFRDAVMQTDPEHPWVSLLTSIVGRMEAAFTAADRGGTSMVPVDLVPDREAVSGLRGATASALSRFLGHEPVLSSGDAPRPTTAATALADAAAFITAAADGYVFLYRQEPRRFVSYQLEFRPFPGLVLLDATADLTGMALLGPPGDMADRVETPRVNYKNLGLYHVPTPKAFRVRMREITRRASTAKPYAEWIASTVVDNTKPGELVLVVTHKAMLDHEYLPLSQDPGKPWILQGRRVLTMHWGSGVGTNWAREAEAVFLFGEFHVPRSAVVANVLGIREQRFRDAPDISDATQGNLTGAYGDLYERHLLRWSIQLGARGRVRDIDASGQCGPMRLYSTMQLDRLLSLRALALPGAPLPVPLHGRPGDQPSGDDHKATQVEKMMTMLSSAHSSYGIIWSKDIEDALGIPSCKVRSLLDHPRVAPVASGYGWRITTRKAAGLRGKGLGLTRRCLGVALGHDDTKAALAA